MDKQTVFIQQQNVLQNFLYVVNRINNGVDYSFVMFGFYFKKEYMDVDLTVEFSELDIITNFVKNRTMTDLMFYYMKAPFLNNCYVFISDDKYNNLPVEDIQWDMRSSLISEEHNPDILLRLNPTWYSENFNRLKYNYEYKGDF